MESQQLMRVFGALLWSLGKAQWANKRWKTSDHKILIQIRPSCFTHAFTPLWVLTCPEVPRVYCGSWWDKPLRHSTFRILFEQEEQALFRDFRAMPQSAALRKLNDLIKRARLARVLALIQVKTVLTVPVNTSSLLQYLEPRPRLLRSLLNAHPSSSRPSSTPASRSLGRRGGSRSCWPGWRTRWRQWRPSTAPARVTFPHWTSCGRVCAALTGPSSDLSIRNSHHKTCLISERE